MYVGLSYLPRERERLERRETDNKDSETGFGAIFLERKKSLRSPTETAFAKLKVGPLTQMHASYRF